LDTAGSGVVQAAALFTFAGAMPAEKFAANVAKARGSASAMKQTLDTLATNAARADVAGKRGWGGAARVLANFYGKQVEAFSGLQSRVAKLMAGGAKTINLT